MYEKKDGIVGLVEWLMKMDKEQDPDSSTMAKPNSNWIVLDKDGNELIL